MAENFKSKMEERVTYILMKAGVTAPEIDECMNWAFGPEAWYVPIYPDWVDRWHKLHPKAFRIRKNDSFVKIIYVIGFMFCMYKQQQKLKSVK